ncbi:MAG: hydrogenase maturation nickel metallochaperone HypA [Verrucomicrobia bacterium]|nr:hydrogenase maturation nickel metallochaperone HypA [Verrucomicrobiota bacterium]
MHEVHIVRELVSKIDREAAAQGARRVTRVHLKFNPLTSHDGEHVQFCFDIVKGESRLLKEAALALTEIPPLVRCRKCGHEFKAHELPDICPQCDSVDLQPVHSTDMTVEGFDIEQ